jgi:hypothetical protein
MRKTPTSDSNKYRFMIIDWLIDWLIDWSIDL